MYKWLFLIYYIGEDTGTGSAAPITFEDLEDDVDESDTEKTDKETKKAEEEDKEEDKEDELDDDKSENKEDDDEIKLDDDEPVVTPPARKEILAKYPDLFKTFPQLEKELYRARAYTEVFSSVEEAKEASEKASALDNFEKDLMQGNTERVLKSVKDQDEKSFHKLVDGYLTTLHKVDEKAYFHVVSNLYKDAVIAMVAEANKSKNDTLKAAAEVFHQFLFGNSDFSPPKRLSTETNKTEDTELERERNQFYKERFELARDEISSRVENTIKSFIEHNIDPKEMLTDYVKKAAIKDAMADLYDQIQKDSQFSKILSRLWAEAHKNKYGKNYQDKIRSAYINKSKTFLPSVIKRARSEALKGLGKRVKEDVEEIETEKTEETEETEKKETRRERSERTPERNSGRTPKDRARNIPAHMSSRDYLMND